MNDSIYKKVLDILPNRKKEYLLQYFARCKNRYSVEFVISDMYEPYLLVTKIMFPKAKYFVDRFHYTIYIMDTLDDIRIRLQYILMDLCRECNIEEFVEASKTIGNWLEYIGNSFIDKSIWGISIFKFRFKTIIYIEWYIK